MGIHKNYINGEWVEGADINIDISPSDTNDVIGEFARSDQQQTNDAIQAAKAARRTWRDVCVNDKSIMLDTIGSEILARKTELAKLLAREEGKTLAEATGEVVRAGMLFKFFSGEAIRLTGDSLASTRPGIDVEITREPVGVVGIISPWNFPIAIPAWKIAPALAFGNTVVLKSADLVPASAWALTEIISRAGLPAGVFNLLMGTGSKVGDTIVNSPDIDAVTFTGSDTIGHNILGKVASRGARVQLEMGGKNPLVVLDDADLDIAVNAAIDGAFFSTGQRCTASSRFIVTRGIHDLFVKRVIERLKVLKVDHALKEGTQIGPVSSQSQLQTDLDYINIGKEEGACLAYGGETLERETQGYYLSPALFTETSNEMRINREEIFGPVATVIRVDNYDEALEVANDTCFGLSSGICSTSLKYVNDFKRNSQAGMVMVNLPTAGIDYHVPFGGRKSSSYGPREQGTYAKEFFTIVKTTYIK